MLCECCEEKDGIIDCKECSTIPGQCRALCAECSGFIHRGAYKNHRLLLPEVKKLRDDIKSKMVVYKSEREWEESIISNLQSIRRDIEERQHMYEEEIKKRITEIQQRLKQQGINMISQIKDMSAPKLEFLDNLSKQISENVKNSKEVEAKMDSLIAEISEFDDKMGSIDESVHEKLTYKLVEWDRSAFPKLSLPLRIDYSRLEEAAENFKLELLTGGEDGSVSQESKPSDVSLQSRIDGQGVFWIQVDLQEEALDKLLSISFDIRSLYMLDRNWKPYSQMEAKPAVGEIVYSLWNEDNKWYRGRVEDLNETHATVLFVDFGNKEKIEFSTILPVGDHDVGDLPFQALECSLFPEPKEIPLNVKFEFTDMIAGGPLHCNILGKCMFGDKEITHIELVKDMPDGSQLNLREYLQGRCSAKKVLMPFTSRDIRLLENPNAFDKPKTTVAEENTEETKKESVDEAGKDEADVEEEKGPDEQPPVEASSTAVPNGTVEHDDIQSFEGRDSPSDIIVEGVDVEEVFNLPTPTVKPGELLQLYIDLRNHQLNRDGSFWAILHRTDKQNQEWERLVTALSHDAEKAQNCAKINEGSVVLANFKKKWHRAKVDVADSERSDNKTKVRLTDRGSSCSINESQLRVMPMKYYCIPAQGIKCTIACAKMKEFPKDSQTHFTKLVEGGVVTAQVTSVGGSAKETCLEVTLTNVNGEAVNVLECLYERELNRKKRAQLEADEIPPGPGIIHLKHRRPSDENWQDDVMMAEHHQGAGQPVVIEDVVHDQEQCGGAPQGVELQHERQHGTGGRAGASVQDVRNDHRYNDRRGYRNDRQDRGSGGGFVWRSGGDPRGCFKCGDLSHQSKNCQAKQRRYKRT